MRANNFLRVLSDIQFHRFFFFSFLHRILQKKKNLSLLPRVGVERHILASLL